MSLCPGIHLTILNGFLLILPMLALRFGIPALMRKEALAELDYFPPVQDLEEVALKIYFISNTFLVFSPLLAKIQTGSTPAKAGWVIYLIGLGMLFTSLLQYCREDGLKKHGVYHFSRNPICVGYFLVYTGTSLLIGSWFHLGLTVIYQIAVHFLILSEERWCLKSYGAQYQSYLADTPRYLILK